MKKRIEELVHGGFDSEAPKLTASVSAFRLVIPEGKKYKGSISLGAEDGSRIRGIVSTYSHRILLAGNHFSGNTCDVVFGIDTEGLHAGDATEGTILISSSLGELPIPVRAEIADTQAESPSGVVQTLDDFAKLCMKSLREGFRVFTGGQFEQILNGKNRAYLALYKGMSHNPVTYQHMEEFLVSAGKKEPVRLTLDKQKKAVYRLDVSQKDTLYIYKNTWGYVRMEIEVTGDFLHVEKKVVTSDDFIGRIYGLEYIVDRERLGRGRRFGRIRIRNVYQVLDFEIEASTEEMKVLSGPERRRKMLWLLRDYLNLQLKTLDYRTWYERACQLVLELREEDKDDLAALFCEAFLAYTNDENARAMELLWPIKEGKTVLTENWQKAAYLCLAKAVNLLPEERRNVAPLLRRYSQQEPDSYLLLHLLHQEDPAYETMPSKVLYELEHCYEVGCTSPFLYLKAWQLLEEQESLLRKLSPFMIQVLNFALKHEVLSEALLLRAAFLSGHQKEFNRPVYRFLAGGYEKYPHREVLEAICKLLMKGDPVRKEYFRWYELAVRQEVRITRLYEYYMETMEGSSSRELPQPVRMYFAYNNTLGERKKAFLYASIIRHKEQDGTSYLNYEKTMERFAAESLKKGRMNEDYAVLYQEFLSNPQTKEEAALLCRVLFMQKLNCSSRNIRKVIVCHNALNQEQAYPCADGEACVAVYSEDACILFEDEKRRRFATTVEYTLEPLMDVKESARRCMELGLENTGLELYCCRERAWQMDVNSRSLDCYRRAAENPDFTEEYRSQVRRKLLDYYMQHREEHRLTEFLLSMDFRQYARVDRVSMAVLLIEKGMYEDAFSVVSEFGYEGIPVTQLLKLASRMILKRDFEEDEELTCLASYVYGSGKYDEIMLTYLRDHYMGTLAELCGLWRNIRDFQLDTYPLDERILLLSMFVRGFPENEDEILESYVMQQGKERVILAFLTYLSARYFLEERKTPEKIFVWLEKIYDREWNMDEVCRLALLKHYSERPSLSEGQERQVRRLLAEFDRLGLRFEFYSRLPAQLIQAYQIEDKVFIEERFRSGSRVIIHYRLQSGEGGSSEWISEPMKNMYHGIFVKEFLLFYGETLTYYLTVMEDGEVRKTETYQLALVDLDTSGITRYKLLNKILAARKLGNRELMDQAVKQYLWQDAFVSEMFAMMQ